MDVAARPMAVSVRTRLAHRKAAAKVRDSSPRTVPTPWPHSRASFTCPSTCASPSTMESRLEATRKRCDSAAAPECS